jgi:hypothetical protein
MKNYNYYKTFNLRKNHYENNALMAMVTYFNQLNKKQKTAFFVTIFCSVSMLMFSAVTGSGGGSDPSPLRTLNELLGNSPYSPDFLMWLSFVDIAKYAINYIVNIQISSIDIIASTPLDGGGAFDKITSGLTIFAAIACFYKLLIHFRDTERFDNVKAFTGFFSYIGILILFIFSSHIVNYVVSFKTNINTASISKIGSTIDNELNQVVIEDFKKYVKKQEEIDAKINSDDTGVVDTALLELKKSWAELTFNLSNTIKYLYYSFFGILMTASLAVPTVIMTLMVKIILSIMILGSKLVFLLAFIPGFENTWKTYMLNLLNVMLWVPIFNIIMTFIIALMSAFLFEHPSGTGQIIWLTIISLILAYQSISLTTTAASTIISGAGAGAGGALGGLNAMSAPAIIAGAAAATAGSAMIASKFSKDGESTSNNNKSKISKD